MKIKKVQPVKSKAQYSISEYTAEYGTIIFDDSRDGTIHNSYMYTIAWNNGQVDCYIDKDSGRFRSIWFVNFAGFEIELWEDFGFREKREYVEPIVDIQEIWKETPYMNQDGSWNRIKKVLPVKVLYNGSDIVQLKFGTLFRQLTLNEKVALFLDKSDILSGILIRDAEEVGKLLTKKPFH